MSSANDPTISSSAPAPSAPTTLPLDAEVTIDAPSRLGSAASDLAAPAGSGSGGVRASVPGDPAWPTVAGYEIFGRLGEGGMGVVWRAVQDGTHRTVALKLMNAASFGSERAQLRFQREVDLTARLDHPGIARVYEGGQRDGVCFYAMELVEGVSLDAYVKQTKLDERQVMLLMKDVCEAVQYAHQKGVIHRDLKPDNILVSSDGRPHVLDFGLAKVMAGGEASMAVSLDGQVAGTPAYMSPEQAAGKGDRVDTRSDVYSLGVILYRLLTGQSPHDLSGSYIQVLTRVSTEEIRRPRDVLPKLNGELEALVLKALAHEPDQRYASAGGLAQDIGNYLAGEPLTARAPTTAYFLRKRLRKYRAPLTAAGCVLVALVAMAVVSYVRVVKARSAAVIARGEAERQAALARTSEARAIQSEKQARAEKDRADAAARSAESRLADSRVAEADAFAAAFRYEAAAAGYREAAELYRTLDEPTAPADLGLWEVNWRLPPALVDFDRIHTTTSNMAFSQDGGMLFTAGQRGMVVIHDTRTGTRLRHLHCGTGELRSVDITADGSLLTMTDTGTLKLFDPSSGRVLRTIELPGDGRSTTEPAERADAAMAAAVPGSRHALTAWGSKLRTWDLNSGTSVRSWDTPGNVVFLSVSGDGHKALVGTRPHKSLAGGALAVRLWDLESGEIVHPLARPGGVMMACAFSPDGRRAASAGSDAVVAIWDLAAGRVVATLSGHRLPVRGLAWSRDGSSLFTASADGTVRQWEAATGRQVRLIVAGERPLHALCLSPDGQLLTTMAHDGRIQGWSLAEGREVRPLRGSHGTVRDVHVSSGGLTVLSSVDSSLVISDVATGKTLRVLSAGPHQVVHGWFMDQGRQALSICFNGLAQVWDVAAGKSTRSFSTAAPVFAATLSEDGSRLAVVGPHQVEMWDVASGARLGSAAYPDEGPILSIVFAPQCQWFLTVGRGVWKWDTATLKPQHAFQQASRNTLCAAFDPQGHRFVTDGTQFYLWDAASGERLKMSRNLTTGQVDAIAFSADGTHLMFGGTDGDLRMMGLSDPPWLRDIPTDEARLAVLAFAPDGTAVTAHSSGDVKIWDFARLAAYRHFEQDLPKATAALEHDPADGAALATLGQWYLFRGRCDWARDLLGRALSHGASVSSLDLARCDWANGALPAARTEFQAALTKGEAPAVYLNLCLSALAAPSDGPATRPATAPVSRPDPNE